MRSGATRPSWWVPAGLVLPALVLTGPALAPGGTLVPTDHILVHFGLADAPPIPHNRSHADTIEQFYPYLTFLTDELKKQNLPLWNPYVLTGTPFLANAVSAALFPFHWLVLVLDPSQLMDLGACLKLILCAWGIYLFLRRRNCSPPASLLGGWAFCLSAYFVFFLLFPNSWVAVFWTWSLVALDLILESPSARRIGLLALCVGAMLLCGQPQAAFLAAVSLGFLTLCLGPHRLAHVIGAGLLGVGVASIQVLPFLDYLFVSETWTLRTPDGRNPFHIPAEWALGLLLPNAWESPVLLDSDVPAVFSVVYVGPLVLLLAGWAWSSQQSLRRIATAFATLAVLAGIIVFGVFPFFDLWTAPPLLRQTNHTHALFLVQGSLAVLAGLGFEGFARRRHLPRGRWLWPGFLLSLYLASLLFVVISQWNLNSRPGTYVFLGWRYPFPWLWLTVGLLFLAFAAALLNRRPVTAAAIFLFAGLAVSYGIHAVHPVTPLTRNLLVELGPELSPHERGAALGVGFWPPDAGMIWSFRDLRGYESVVPRGIGEGLGQLQGYLPNPHHFLPDLTAGDLPVLQRLGVSWILSPSAQTMAGLEQISTRFPFRYRLAEGYRTHWAWSQQVGESPSPAELLRRPDLTLVHLDPAPPPGSGYRPANLPPGSATSGIQWVRDDPDDLAWELSPPGDGAWFVLRDLWFPGWRAWLDESEVPLYRTDGLFRAVWIPAGTHRLVMEYRSRAFRWGLVVSVFSCLVLVGLLFKRAPRMIFPR
ncbi:MAG TPA: hypothetical protein P5057_07085 [Acidobacteriota bacterium]|nr:hypothetical protein [Acidobacteriota bacterium]